MQLFTSTALMGFLLATTEASRCKTRPSPSHETKTRSIEPVPQASATTFASYSLTPASSTFAMSEPLIPVPESSALPSTAETTIEAASASTESPIPATPTTPSSSKAAASATSSVAASPANIAAGAVPIVNAPAAAQMCGENQDTLLTEWGLVVSNFRVEESTVEGTVCTTYNGMVTLANGQAAANFTADANLVFDEATINDNKFYSNVGLGANVPSQLSSVSSIPASYSWSRTNTTAFRGNVVFDLVLAPTSDDRTSSATQEVMMWLHWQGDQQPLAWNNGTKATFDLYGVSWNMFQGINYNLANGEGVQVTTIQPQQDYGETGSWSGDIKDWLDALVTQGVFTDDYYITNANAGTEQYWGDSVLESVVALKINLNA